MQEPTGIAPDVCAGTNFIRRNALRLLTPYGVLRRAPYAGYGVRLTRVTVCALRGLRLLTPYGVRLTRV